jgi:MarR family transcriptional regulator for hemolysin
MVAGYMLVSRELRSIHFPARLTLERYWILGLIDEHEKVSIRDLAALAGVAAPTMSRTVTFLEMDGIVKKQGSSADGRYIGLSLTARGRKVFAAAKKKWLVHLKEALSRLSSEEIETLRNLAHLMRTLRHSSE